MNFKDIISVWFLREPLFVWRTNCHLGIDVFLFFFVATINPSSPEPFGQTGELQVGLGKNGDFGSSSRQPTRWFHPSNLAVAMSPTQGSGFPHEKTHRKTVYYLTKGQSLNCSIFWGITYGKVGKISRSNFSFRVHWPSEYFPIHDWLIFMGFHVGKYTSHMDAYR